MWIWVQMQHIVTWANLTFTPSGISIRQYNNKEHYTSLQANNSHAAIFRTTGTIAYMLFGITNYRIGLHQITSDQI